MLFPLLPKCPVSLLGQLPAAGSAGSCGVMRVGRSCLGHGVMRALRAARKGWADPLPEDKSEGIRSAHESCFTQGCMSCRCLGAQLGAALPTCPSLGLCSALCSCAPWPFPWGFQHSPGSCPAAALGLGAGIWRPLWLLGVNAAADGVLQGCCCAPPFMVLRHGLGHAREDIAVGWQCPKTTCFCLLCWPSPGCRVSYLLTCSPSAFCSLAPSQPAPQCRLRGGG